MGQAVANCSKFLPVLQRLKETYLLWSKYYKEIPKIHRHTLGQKIDRYLVDTIEVVAFASFLKRDEKISYVRLAIRKVDTLNILLMIMWESKSLDHKKYITLSEKLDEIGRMLGGWYGNLEKENSPK